LTEPNRFFRIKREKIVYSKTCKNIRKIKDIVSRYIFETDLKKNQNKKRTFLQKKNIYIYFCKPILPYTGLNSPILQTYTGLDSQSVKKLTWHWVSLLYFHFYDIFTTVVLCRKCLDPFSLNQSGSVNVCKIIYWFWSNFQKLFCTGWCCFDHF